MSNSPNDRETNQESRPVRKLPAKEAQQHLGSRQESHRKISSESVFNT